MEIIFTEELRQRCLQFGACEDLPRVGLPIENIRQKHLIWAEDQNLPIDEVLSEVLKVPLWAFSKNGYGSGYYGCSEGSGSGGGDGYYGYGSGYYGCSDGYGSGGGDGYYGYGSGYYGYGSGYYGCSEGSGSGGGYYGDGVSDGYDSGLNLYQTE